MITFYKEKYNKLLEEPFMIGYLTHLITDRVYYTEIVPKIVELNKDIIKDYLTKKYSKYNYTPKEQLTNAEYLVWSHEKLYSVFDDYNFLPNSEEYDIFPNLSELKIYLEKWENSDKEFKPSMIEDLNDYESIILFLEDSYMAKSVEYAKNALKAINNRNKPRKNLLVHELYLKFMNRVDNCIDENKEQ